MTITLNINKSIYRIHKQLNTLASYIYHNHSQNRKQFTSENWRAMNSTVNIFTHFYTLNGFTYLHIHSFEHKCIFELSFNGTSQLYAWKIK